MSLSPTAGIDVAFAAMQHADDPPGASRSKCMYGSGPVHRRQRQRRSPALVASAEPGDGVAAGRHLIAPRDPHARGRPASHRRTREQDCVEHAGRLLLHRNIDRRCDAIARTCDRPRRRATGARPRRPASTTGRVAAPSRWSSIGRPFTGTSSFGRRAPRRDAAGRPRERRAGAPIGWVQRVPAGLVAARGDRRDRRRRRRGRRPQAAAHSAS